MSDPARFPAVRLYSDSRRCVPALRAYRQAPARLLSFYQAQRGRVREVLRNWPERDVRFIVVTSGQRILGLGDLGANGMGIPIGKLALYTACGGVPPHFTLPILIDCRHQQRSSAQRTRSTWACATRAHDHADLDEFVEEFMTAVQEVFPGCCVQFEDWAGDDAVRLLARYRDRVLLLQRRHPGHGGGRSWPGSLERLRITGGRLCEQTFAVPRRGRRPVSESPTC